MRMLMKKLAFLFLPLLGAFLVIPGAVVAQNATPSAGMLQFSNLEEQILQQRRSLLDQEEAVQTPIWIRDTQGIDQIIDGSDLQTRIEGLVTVAQLMGLEGLAIDQLGLTEQFMARLLSEDTRADIVARKLASRYARDSHSNRIRAMENFDRMLDFARDQFELERQKRDNGMGLASHICQQAQSPDARRFNFRYWGNSPWYLFVQNGSVYCQVERINGPSFPDEQYFAYVTISGEYLKYTTCPNGECVESTNVYKASYHHEGDRRMDGRIYESRANETGSGVLSNFNWWQCYPIPADHDGRNMCPNDLAVD